MGDHHRDRQHRHVRPSGQVPGRVGPLPRITLTRALAWRLLGTSNRRKAMTSGSASHQNSRRRLAGHEIH